MVRELAIAGVMSDEIVAVFKIKANDVWHVTLEDGVTTQQAMKQDVFRADRFYMTAERCDQRRVFLWVHWLPIIILSTSFCLTVDFLRDVNIRALVPVLQPTYSLEEQPNFWEANLNVYPTCF